MPPNNEVCYKMDFDDPSPELLEWAKNNIKENPETKCQIISDLRDLIYARGECTPHRTDDAFLLRFLRARNFSLEGSYKLFVNYYDFKEDNPEFFEGVNLSYLKTIGEYDIITVPPYREGTGRRLLIGRAENWDPEQFTVTHLFQAMLALLEAGLLEQRAQIMGGIIIVDLKGLTLQQALCMTPRVARKIIQIMTTSFPIKVHAMHVVNESRLFDVVYSIMRPFLNDRMRERVFFHGEDMENLHKHIDPKYLPERYGGIHPDYSYKPWIDYFKRSERLINELKSLGYEDHEGELLELQVDEEDHNAGTN